MAHVADKRALLSGILLPSAGKAGRRRLRMSCATSVLLQLAHGRVRHGRRWRPGCWPGGKAQQSESMVDELQPEALGLEARSSWREGREPSEQGGGARLRV